MVNKHRLRKTHLDIIYAMQNTGVNLLDDVGPSIHIKNILRELIRSGHHIDILQLTNRNVILSNGISEHPNCEATALGVTGLPPFLLMESVVRRLQAEFRMPYFAFFDSLRFYEACSRVLENYDLCHEYQGLFSMGAALSCKGAGIPYVLTVDADLLLEYSVLGRPLRGVHRLIAEWEAKISYKAAQRIICVSEPAKRHFVEFWGVASEKICVVPNGVDIDLFGYPFDAQKIRAEFGLEDALVVGFVGGFYPWHGLKLLVESFPRILAETTYAKLLLVGDGPTRLLLKRMADGLGISDSVIFTGSVPQARVPELLSVVDVSVLPYPRLPGELWFSPLKLYEYMAAGKAIVASRAGQIAEVIKDDYSGILVEPGNIDELACSIVRLLKDSAEREWLGRNARQQALERHSWAQYIHHLEQIYQSVL